jgi:hypothetical protein
METPSPDTIAMLAALDYLAPAALLLIALGLVIRAFCIARRPVAAEAGVDNSHLEDSE